MNEQVTRRTFLASTAGAVALTSSMPRPARARNVQEPLGPVVARTGSRGLTPGSRRDPTRSTVTMLDGRTLEVAHTSPMRIGPRKSLLVTPDPSGTWSILYAEC